jgi:hypothetical protein
VTVERTSAKTRVQFADGGSAVVEGKEPVVVEREEEAGGIESAAETSSA